MSGIAPTPAGQVDDTDPILMEAPADDSSPAHAQTRLQALWSTVLSSRNAAITAVGIVIFLFFSVTVPDTWLSSDNLSNVVRNIGLSGIVAVGMTFLMIAGGIDLSVGSVFGFLTMVLGGLIATQGVDPWIGTIIVIVLGCLIGLMNGLITTKIKIPPFILTLAGLTAFRSLALIVSNERPYAVGNTGFFYDVTGGNINGVVPWFVIWMAAVMLIGGFILSRTKFGYHVYATGGSLEAAQNSGINTDRVKIICFMMVGGLCGLISGLELGYLHGAAPITGTGFEFKVIGAAIVGGVALTGGRGSIYGTLVGAVIISMITSGLVLLGLSSHWGDIVTGLFILFAGSFDLYVRHLASRSLRYLET